MYLCISLVYTRMLSQKLDSAAHWVDLTSLIYDAIKNLRKFIECKNARSAADLITTNHLFSAFLHFMLPISVFLNFDFRKYAFVDILSLLLPSQQLLDQHHVDTVASVHLYTYHSTTIIFLSPITSGYTGSPQ